MTRAETRRAHEQIPGRPDPWPSRRHEPWTVAEDRKLLRMVRRLHRRGERGWPLWAAVGRLHNRSACAVATRHQIVLAAIRWSRAERKIGGH